VVAIRKFAAIRNAIFTRNTSLKKEQFAVTHTIREAEIPALLDTWVTNTPSVKILCPQKKKLASPYIFVKTEHA
jgi:hypothetical protein